MKNLKLAFAAFCLFAFNITIAQEKNESKFSLIGTGGIGFVIVQNDSQSNYNLNSNAGELLLNYKITDKFGIASGIGVNELSGNGLSTLGNFYHERTLLKIPLIATLNYKIDDKLRILASFGFYGQTITKDQYRFQSNSELNVFGGWNYGVQISSGFVFRVSKNFSTGLNFAAQSDLTKLNSNPNRVINDKQKFKNLNTIGLLLIIDL